MLVRDLNGGEIRKSGHVCICTLQFVMCGGILYFHIYKSLSEEKIQENNRLYMSD